MEGKGLKDKQLGLKKLDIKLIQKSHVNVFEPVMTIRYNADQNDWEILPQERVAENSVGVTSLTLLTYNVWFGTHNYTERLRELKRIFSELQPDFICLQEVTEKFQNLLCADLDFARHYYISGSQKLNQSGVVIFSRFPFSCRELQFESQMSRALLLAEAFVNGQKIVIATTQLELGGADVRATRDAQFAVARDTLRSLDTPHVIFAGDFSSLGDDEHAPLNADFDDVWPQLAGEDAGHTLVNAEQRTDRIYLRRGAGVRARSVRLVGHDPLPLYA